MSRGGFAKLLSGLQRLIIYSSAKAYGAAALSFGLLTVIIGFLRNYTTAIGDTLTVTLVFGAVCAILAIPLLLTERPLAFVFQDNAITDYVFFELLCMKRVPRTGSERSVPTAIAAFVGILLAVIGYFVPTWVIVAAAGALLTICLGISSPEFSFLLTVMLLPYSSASDGMFAVFHALIGLTFLSMILKISYGKRVIFFNQYDIIISLIMVMIVISGIFMKGSESFGSAASMLLMTFGYTVSSCLISNRRLADCALGTLVISAVPVSVISAYRFFAAVRAGQAGALIGVGIASTFTDTVACALFLLTSICSAAALMRQGSGVLRILCSAAMLLMLFALVLTGEATALVALIFGLLVYAIIKTRYFSILLLPLLLLLPYGVLLLSDATQSAICSVIPSLSQIGSLSELWSSMLTVISKHPMIGIGMGDVSFNQEMLLLGLPYTDGAHNLLLELALQAGIPCAALFFILMAVRLRHLAVYYPYVKSSEVAKLCPILAVTLFVFMFYGSTAYIWHSMDSFYLFWVVFGIGGALLRIAAREHDDRVNYYEDNSANDASDLDVSL